MHVDRKQFLIFAAAIAAGCGAGQQSNASATEPGSDYDTTAGGSAAPSAQPQPVPVDGQIAREELVEAPTPPPPVQPPPPVPAFEGGMYAMPTPTAEAVASDPRCGSLKPPGPVCESFYDTVSSCYSYGGVLNKKAASAAVNCLVQKSGKKAICEFGVDAACALKGAKAEPTDKSTAQACGTIMTNCSQAGYRGKDLSKANCQAALSGFQPRVRGALIGCITEFCEISTCFYQVKY